MKIENNNNYYNVEDEINFEKLKNFRKFNSNVKSITQSNDRNIRYANSDKNYFNNILKINVNKSIRLVRGSHIITKKLYEEDVAFTLQNDDNRIVFVIPYKEEFSLIGTTEVDVNTPDNPSISDDEKIYLINSINNHFVKQISQVDIVDTYSGIRPLIEDFKEASKVSRDYVFDLNIQKAGSPLLNIYGGKLTTYRKLSEKVMEELTPYLPNTKTKNWTATKQL